VVDKRFEDKITQKQFEYDPGAKIELVSYAPNYLVYNINAAKDQLVVFSEIYYIKGWNAYIDGDKSPYFRADYILRAMVVPAGKHIIEFKFEPQIWNVGTIVSLISSILLSLSVVLLIFWRIINS
jgi:uncharacterized membrane protein YfhO